MGKGYLAADTGGQQENPNKYLNVIDPGFNRNIV